MKRGALMWLATAVAFAAPTLAAPDPRQLAVLKRFAGEWDVSVSVRRPIKTVVRYTESAVLTPGGRLLRTSTSVKPDGSQDWSMMTFDPASGGYPIWIFTSSGATFYLAPGKWDEQTHSISWEAPAASPVSHKTRCTFVDERMRSCETIVKDWKGSVLLEQGYTAVRR